MTRSWIPCGVAGLILGAAAAKVGLFKGLLLAILALKKFVIIAVIALVALLKRVLGKRNATPTQRGAA